MIANEYPTRLAGNLNWFRMRRIAGGFLRTVGIASLLFAYADITLAEGLGQLFFSTEERHILDERRDSGEGPAPVTLPGTDEPEAPMVGVISFDGKVERSGGGSTVWVNGRPVYTGSRTVEGIGIESSPGSSSETQVQLPRNDGDGKPTEFSLKVGQKVAVQNGQKFDAYERRPGEDAESVFEKETPAEGTPPAEGATDEGDSAAPVVPAKGS